MWLTHIVCEPEYLRYQRLSNGILEDEYEARVRVSLGLLGRPNQTSAFTIAIVYIF